MSCPMHLMPTQFWAFTTFTTHQSRTAGEQHEESKWSPEISWRPLADQPNQIWGNAKITLANWMQQGFFWIPESRDPTKEQLQWSHWRVMSLASYLVLSSKRSRSVIEQVRLQIKSPPCLSSFRLESDSKCFHLKGFLPRRQFRRWIWGTFSWKRFFWFAWSADRWGSTRFSMETICQSSSNHRRWFEGKLRRRRICCLSGWELKAIN